MNTLGIRRFYMKNRSLIVSGGTVIAILIIVTVLLCSVMELPHE